MDTYESRIARDPELYADAFQPEPDQTIESSLKAVKEWGRQLFFVRKDLRTYEICLEAVSNYGIALVFVPPEFQTEELCKIAISNTRLALQYVPEQIKLLIE